MHGPVDIIVPGIPVSIQMRGIALQDWKRKVASAASRKFAEPSDKRDIAIAVTYFYRVPPKFDADNMSKPICDALNKIAYHDDRQIVERVVRRVKLAHPFRIWGLPKELVLALREGRDFVFIRVSRIQRMSWADLWHRDEISSTILKHAG
jgi:endodeoxyribonuclease RusA